MLSNPGGMIKYLAVFVLILGIIASFVLGINLGPGMEAESNAASGNAFGTMFLGMIVSFVTSLFLYGFGQLIEDTMRIREKLESPQIAAVLQNASAQPEAPMKNTPDDTEEQDAPAIPLTREQRRDGWACPHCRFVNMADRVKCAFCGRAK